MISGWAHYPMPTTPPGPPSNSNHTRSHSNVVKTPGDQLPTRISRAISASAINNGSLNTLSPNARSMPKQRAVSYNDADENLSTIPDPRIRTMSSESTGTTASPLPHPDLNQEVATLSNKLINAINYQTNLDDTLSQTRHELEASKNRIKVLEHEAEQHARLIASGSLVSFDQVQVERKKLLSSLAEESGKRATIEREKAEIEKELENLTTALFEEANKMVITAREEAQKAHEEMERENKHLRAQLADKEALLKSHQDQISGLKQVMVAMNEGKEEHGSVSAPPTPALRQAEFITDVAAMMASMEIDDLGMAPSYPTSFAHLIQPILRTDTAAYDDFINLVRMSKTPGSRVSSGSYGGLSLGLGLVGAYPSSPIMHQSTPNSSNSSLNTTFTANTPTTPASATSNPGGTIQTMALKDTRFYKRALAEDIEPTLRLDTAPGLSWLARRGVLAAMCEGTLVVDPLPGPDAAKLSFTFTCTLCGEARKDAKHARTHRFRTTESDNAQRYPLCRYCLARIRSTCDFLGFLRMLKDGHWKCEDEEAEKHAWVESVRLREQMFWARMGGGVIPVVHPGSSVAQSVRTSADLSKLEILKEIERTGELKPRDVTPTADEVTAIAGRAGSRGAPGISVSKRSSQVPKADTAEGLWQAAQEDAQPPKSDDVVEHKDEHDSVPSEIQHQEAASKRSSAQSLAPSDAGKTDGKRLSLTIPKSDASQN